MKDEEILRPINILNHLRDFTLEYTENGLDRRFIIGSCNEIEVNLRKLECLEHIEKRLGISIVTLIRAFDEGIKFRDGKIINYSYHLALTDSNKCLEFHILEEQFVKARSVTVRLADYGKTWCLSGEELL